VWAVQPIWHPNIDLFSGKVSIPVAWSPVLTLNSVALGVQMIMLEPSSENPLNIEAYSYYMSNFSQYEMHTQSSLQGGCIISGMKFTRCLMGGDVDPTASMICDSDTTSATHGAYLSQVDINGKSSKKRSFNGDDYDGNEAQDDDEKEGEKKERRVSHKRLSSTDRHRSTTSGRYGEYQQHQVEHSQQDEFERDIYVSYSQLSLHGCEGSSSSSSDRSASYPFYGLSSGQQGVSRDRGTANKRSFNAVSEGISISQMSSPSHCVDADNNHSSLGSNQSNSMMFSVPTTIDGSAKRFKSAEESDRVRDRMVTAL